MKSFEKITRTPGGTGTAKVATPMGGSKARAERGF
jgi:hypothetical protein